jgi:diguanylate cyclase (GGDEF)-like protein
MVQDVFQAEQVILYLVPNPGAEDEKGEELILQSHRGVSAPEAIRRIKVGDGRIGWAAETKVEWIAEDWMNQSRTEGRAIADNHSSLRLDLIGPLVHYTKSGPALLGVLCVGLSDKNPHPRDSKRLLQLITGLGSIAIMNARRVSELSAKANHDGLTGLINKRHFLVELGTLIHRAESENQPLGIFIFDIDHFKKYNDANGHLKGDELLKAMAALIKRSVRPGDMVGRYGGEEFLVAMPRADRDGALALAERIRQAVESHPFEHGDKQPLGRITVSGGVAAFPHDGSQGGELIHGADQALYEAKRGGRNRVLPFRRVDLGDAVPHDPALAAAPIPDSDR